MGFFEAGEVAPVEWGVCRPWEGWRDAGHAGGHRGHLGRCGTGPVLGCASRQRVEICRPVGQTSNFKM